MMTAQIPSIHQESIEDGGQDGLSRLWRKSLGLLVGYGHAPARALYWLGGLAVATMLFAALALGPSTGLLESTHGSRDVANVAAGPCELSDRVTYATMIAVPLIGGGADRPCRIVSGGTVSTLLAMGEFGVQILGWLLASIFVAGLLGAIRLT